MRSPPGIIARPQAPYVQIYLAGVIHGQDWKMLYLLRNFWDSINFCDKLLFPDNLRADECPQNLA